MRFVLASVTMIGGILVACSTSSTTTNTGGDGGASSSSGGSSGTTSSSGASSSGSTGKPAASTTEVTITIDAGCSTFSACGGELSGTYDYARGCLGDLFSEIRNSCQSLDTTKVNATVKGSIYFLADGVLERNVTATVSGSVKFAASCAGGSCTIVETALKNEFPGTSCTLNASDCDCNVSRTQTNTAATTFKISGNTVTTADGDQYDFCVDGSKLTYKGKTAEAEDGTWDLTKR